MRVHRDVMRARRKPRRRFERGEGRLKGILIVVVVVLVIYSAIKIVPAYVNDYQLSDKMQEQARFAVVNHYTEDQIRDNNSVVKISLEYIVPVDVLVYHTDLHFSPNSENKSLL